MSPEDWNGCLEKIPDEEIHPMKPTDLTIYSSSDTAGLFLKHGAKSWSSCWKGTRDCAQLLLGEVEAFELIHRNPHPNIVRYHDCKVNRRDRIVGIVMDFHERTLQECFDDDPGGFDKPSCFKGIEIGNQISPFSLTSAQRFETNEYLA